jgi:hypothetical protein
MKCTKYYRPVLGFVTVATIIQLLHTATRQLYNTIGKTVVPHLQGHFMGRENWLLSYHWTRASNVIIVVDSWLTKPAFQFLWWYAQTFLNARPPLLRGGTWLLCCVERRGWCAPWNSSSCMASSPPAYSKGVCSYGTLWVSGCGCVCAHGQTMWSVVL